MFLCFILYYSRYQNIHGQSNYKLFQKMKLTVSQSLQTCECVLCWRCQPQWPQYCDGDGGGPQSVCEKQWERQHVPGISWILWLATIISHHTHKWISHYFIMQYEKYLIRTTFYLQIQFVWPSSTLNQWEYGALSNNREIKVLVS